MAFAIVMPRTRVMTDHIHCGSVSYCLSAAPPVHLCPIHGCGFTLCTILLICYDIGVLISLYLPQPSHRYISVRP
jgi:hypothetical protein